MNATDLTDVIVRFGWVATAGIHLFAAVILGWVLLLQTIRRRMSQREKQLMELWQPLMIESLISMPASLPPLEVGDRKLLLFLWNHMQESIKGQASDRLNLLAKRIGLDTLAFELLRTTTLRDRLLAVSTLGHLKDPHAWADLTRLGQSENAILSLEAVRALVRIDSERAVPAIAPWIGVRRDWSPLKLMTILSQAGPRVVADAMALVLPSAEPTILARLIRHLASTHCVAALSAVRQRLQQPETLDDVTAACLSFLGECSDPLDLSTVRAHLGHPTWFVRLQAASALGKMGILEDEALLVRLLDDPHWWVRYRAAEALTNLPTMTEDKMERLQMTMCSLESQEIIIPFMARLRLKNRALAA